MELRRTLLVMFFISFSSLSASAKIDDERCKDPGRSTDITMIDIMYNEMRIDVDAIDRTKTKSVIIANNPVDERFSQQAAIDTFKKDPDNWLSVKDYMEIYRKDNPRNLIIEFTYFTKNNKKNIFLVSSSVNDYECAVRFNGYIVVKREF